MKNILIWMVIFLSLSLLAAPRREANNSFQPVTLQSRLTHVQPMTGIMMWESTKNTDTRSVQLEFVRSGFNKVVKIKGQYDWSDLELRLNEVASRQHQAVLRFYEIDPSEKKSTVPDYLKALPKSEYQESKLKGTDIDLPDWSSQKYQSFFMEFYENLAKKYDLDKRVACLQIGFGSWAEYHICTDQGCPEPEDPGKNFPSFKFQQLFLQKLNGLFKQTPWMISQDAHVKDRAPFESNPSLLDIKFGIFDDTFHRAWRADSGNLAGWTFFGSDRYILSPMGGEIPLPDKAKLKPAEIKPQQELADLIDKVWRQQASNFHITFMLGAEWPDWFTADHILMFGLDCGYRFKVTSFEASANTTKVKIKNVGVAPIYFDAFVQVNGVRSKQSLKGILPGKEQEFDIAAGGTSPKLTIESDRLLPEQRIEFEADLKGIN